MLNFTFTKCSYLQMNSEINLKYIETIKLHTLEDPRNVAGPIMGMRSISGVNPDGRQKPHCLRFPLYPASSRKTVSMFIVCEKKWDWEAMKKKKDNFMSK